MAAKVIVMINNKGGVGKTTLTTNLGDGLGRLGNNVLVIDLDPQGNSSSLLSPVNPERLGMNVGDLMMADDPLIHLGKCLIEETGFKRVNLLPANLRLDIQAEEIHMKMFNASFRLKKVVDEVKDLYDFIIIDCPPRLSGVLPANALACADHVIVPIESGDEFSISGLENVLVYVSRAKSQLNPGMATPFCLMNKVSRRTLGAKQTEHALRTRVSEKADIELLETSVPESVQAKNSLMARTPIISYKDNTAIADAIRDLADEVNHRVGGKPRVRGTGHKSKGHESTRVDAA